MRTEMLNIYDIEEEVTITPDTVSLILQNMENLSERVSQVFSDYCKVFGYHPAYGVEKFEVQAHKLYILQDTSARSCYNSENHHLDLQYLYLEGDERLALMRAHKQEQDTKAAEKQREENKRQLAHLEARSAELRDLLSGVQKI